MRSFDLVWLIHLIGDAHQPLHATARFSHDLPNGDQGNKTPVTSANGMKAKLHFYGDGLLGSYSTPEGAVYDALTETSLKLPAAAETAAADLDPDHWFQQSKDLAVQYAYAEPVKSATQAAELDRRYETDAMRVTRAQAALAGARLANLIDASLR